MSKKRGSTHHIIPQSRGGPRESWNELDKKTKMHQAWHTLFGPPIVVLPCEAINKIHEELTTKPGHLNKTGLSRKQIKSWNKLFGENASPKKAIKIIEEEWTFEFEWCFQFKECFKFHNPEKVCPVLELYKEGKLINKKERKKFFSFYFFGNKL